MRGQWARWQADLANEAVAYVAVRSSDPSGVPVVRWGVGIDEDVVSAGLQAVARAVSRARG